MRESNPGRMRSVWRQLAAMIVALPMIAVSTLALPVLAIATAMLLPGGTSRAAEPSTALDTYLNGLNTWTGEFTQVVVDANGKAVPEANESGRLTIVRPGKFRWEARSPEVKDIERVMVADGRDLWFLDLDLEQVTVKPLKDSFMQSPALLLAGATNLRSDYEVSADGRRDNSDWVRVKPRKNDSDFREALFGFSGKELSRMVLVNKMGQRSTLTFRGVKRNATVDPKLVEFTVPKGFDVIGKPTATR